MPLTRLPHTHTSQDKFLKETKSAELLVGQRLTAAGAKVKVIEAEKRQAAEARQVAADARTERIEADKKTAIVARHRSTILKGDAHIEFLVRRPSRQDHVHRTLLGWQQATLKSVDLLGEASTRAMG